MGNRELVFRGNIYLVDLGNALGSEQGKERYCLCCQNNTGNKFSPTTIMVPLTTKTKRDIPTHFLLEKSKYQFLSESSTVLCEQIKALDKQRIIRFIGSIEDEDMEIIDKCLKIALEL